MAEAARDQNHVTSALGVSSANAALTLPFVIDPLTGRLLTDTAAGSGTVSSVSVVTANGFAGSVATPTTTPAITLETTVSGLLKGNGTAISAAVANTDYQSPITLTTTGTSGASTFNGVTLNIPQYQAAGTYVTSVSGTTNRVTVTGTTTPVIDISASYVGQTSITTLGTVATGTWNATIITGQYGGTGVANTGKTITVSGNTTIGSSTNTVAFATTNNTSVTLPTTGTLATLAGSEVFTNKTIAFGSNTLTDVAGTTAAQTITSKRMQPRTASSTTASNLSPDLSTANVYFRTTQTATLTIDAPAGTPVIGEVIMIYVDSAGAQTLTINSTYKAFGAAFPATTTAGKTFMMSSQYNGTDWKTLWANAV